MSLSDHLDAAGLSQYFDTFEAVGYETLEAFTEMSLDDKKSVAEDEIGMEEEDIEKFVASLESPSRLKGYKVGVVSSKEEIKGKKLCKLSVDIGEEDSVQIVTNAKVSEGERVVIATIGAVLPSADEDEEPVAVKKASVGGVASHGMLCDAPMLGWPGSTGVAITMPGSFAIGSQPPDEKPDASIFKS